MTEEEASNLLAAGKTTELFEKVGEGVGGGVRGKGVRGGARGTGWEVG